MSNEYERLADGLIKKCQQLEAEKAELVGFCVHKETCDLTYGLTNTGKCTCGLSALIQKHAKK